jgi:hypothetical protein
MVRRSFLTFVLMATSFHAAASADGAVGPSANLLFQIEKQNRRHPWFRVTTDSTRLTVRAQRIDERGLRGLSAPVGTLPPPGLLPWTEVVRLDEVVTRAGQGRVVGAIPLGLAGAGLGT